MVIDMKSLEIENFYSIRDRQVIDLSISAKVPDPDGRFLTLPTMRVPHIVAMFGPNASGKSNVLRALAFISWFIQHSFTLAPETALPFMYFANDGGSSRPTRLAAEFMSTRNLLEPFDPIENPLVRYRYSLELAHRANVFSIVAQERLEFWPTGKGIGGVGTLIFSRDSNGQINGSRFFNVKQYGRALNKIRSNCSVISMLCQYDHAPSLKLKQDASRLVTNILGTREDFSDSDTVKLYANIPIMLDALNHQMQRIDVGIERAIVIQGHNGPTLQFQHYGLDQPISLSFQSHGTRQFLKIFPIIHAALLNGGLAAIDELDFAIHPALIPEILRWFIDPIHNPNHARLWFTCQNVSVMEHLVKEEIFFCAKDHQGGTSVYGLGDIEGVRRNDNFMRKYLGGAYGALPRVG